MTRYMHLTSDRGYVVVRRRGAKCWLFCYDPASTGDNRVCFAANGQCYGAVGSTCEYDTEDLLIACEIFYNVVNMGRSDRLEQVDTV